VFGIAHVGIYQLALYQTVLLGVAFGIAYAEGGLLAAFTVHAAWNLLRLSG
jgi:membrane protease YdiL (CAAX protease family)